MPSYTLRPRCSMNWPCRAGSMVAPGLSAWMVNVASMGVAGLAAHADVIAPIAAATATSHWFFMSHPPAGDGRRCASLADLPVLAPLKNGINPSRIRARSQVLAPRAHGADLVFVFG